MEYHEASNIFPLDKESIDNLAEDIRQHGLLCPIEICDGKILDGRRRWMACRMAEVEAETVEVAPDDPVAYVLSLNLHRRHLTPSQRSMVGARAREMYDTAAKERMKEGQRHGGKARHGSSVENLPQSSARDAAGKALGVSGKTIDFASKVLKSGTPELIKAVDEGRMAVSTAAVHASESADEQKRILESGRLNRKYKPGVGGGNELVDRTEEKEPETNGKVRGIGIQRAHEAIGCLKRIPKNDALRKRGFQVVTDWIRHNK